MNRLSQVASPGLGLSRLSTMPIDVNSRIEGLIVPGHSETARSANSRLHQAIACAASSSFAWCHSQRACFAGEVV